MFFYQDRNTVYAHFFIYTVHKIKITYIIIVEFLWFYQCIPKIAYLQNYELIKDQLNFY